MKQEPPGNYSWITVEAKSACDLAQEIMNRMQSRDEPYEEICLCEIREIHNALQKIVSYLETNTVEKSVEPEKLEKLAERVLYYLRYLKYLPIILDSVF